MGSRATALVRLSIAEGKFLSFKSMKDLWSQKEESRKTEACLCLVGGLR